ncbi:MAG: hypothetical protein IKI95_00880 [Clostridia bacterium]|nr:hypothetical protein [Clostridia bacterium]
MANDIRIILSEENGRIDLLYNGYNIIADSIYNEELTKKIVEMITTELKNTSYDFTTLKKFLEMK